MKSVVTADPNISEANEQGTEGRGNLAMIKIKIKIIDG